VLGTAVFTAVMAVLILFSGGPRTEEVVIVLPSADGHVGSVVVKRGVGRVVLDRAYQANRISSTGIQQTETLTEQSVRQEFRTTLAALPKRPISFVLYFVSATDEMTDEAKLELNNVLAELRERVAADIVLVGHTDRVGSDEANDVLSLMRSERVKSELVGHGVAAERIRTVGRGERELVVETADEVEEPKNRRVEVFVR
jgi:outer membrane protein OmpA-like peptidoglycan-associated protein